MSEIRGEKLNTGKGIMEQMDKNTLQKFEAMSRDRFQDLMMEINLFNEREEEKLKKELKNIKGLKKKLVWKE